MNLTVDDPARRKTRDRVVSSGQYLVDHYHEVPVHVIPCFAGRVEGQGAVQMASAYGSIIQAGWSFMLAARARGLGTCWTTLHLFFEAEAARVLGIPYDQVTQVGLIALGHARGTAFKPATRQPLSAIVHWDEW